mgnify:CR=1 FL=1
MSNFLFLFFKNFHTFFISWFIKVLLSIKGIKVGKNFRADSFPKLILENSNFIIGDNVVFFGEIEIRILKSSSLKISNNCKIDDKVRIISTNNAKIEINDLTSIGKGTVINGGTDIYLGKNCLISGYVYLQSSSHGYEINQFIREQNHTYKKIEISNDVWIGAHSFISMGTIVKNGGIIGANSFVKKNTLINENEIFAGTPAKLKSNRK